MLPWLTGTLTITRAALDAVEAHARACHPAEACGLLAGPADDAHRVDVCLRFDNLADRYHALDPEAYPRTSRDAYRMNDKKRLDAIERGAREGTPVKVLYHSHCDCGAYFSEEDRTQAAREGALVAQVAWLVTSVREGGIVDDHKLFVHDAATGDFVRMPYVVV